LALLFEAKLIIPDAMPVVTMSRMAMDNSCTVAPHAIKRFQGGACLLDMRNYTSCVWGSWVRIRGFLKNCRLPWPSVAFQQNTLSPWLKKEWKYTFQPKLYARPIVSCFHVRG
jgi:hypothetical protein